MTLRSSSLKLSNWKIKKNAPLMVVISLLWLFAQPIYTYIIVNNMRHSYEDALMLAVFDRIKPVLQESIISEAIFMEGGNAAISLILGVVFAIIAYNWLNNQSMVDFYRSQPIKELTIFRVTNINEYIIFALPHVVTLIMSNIVIAALGMWGKVFIVPSIMCFVLSSLSFLTGYFLGCIAVFLTGNVFLSILASGVFLLIEPLIYLLDYSLKNEFFKTYYASANGLYGEAIEHGFFVTPVETISAFCANVRSGTGSFGVAANYKAAAIYIVLLAAQILVYAVISRMIYVRRPALTGGKMVVFDKIKPVVKIVLLVVDSLYVGLLFSSMDYTGTSAGLMVFGIICGLVVLQLLFQALLEGDAKACLKGWKSFGIAAVITAVVFLIYFFDVFGYDKYLPDTEDVEAIAVSREIEGNRDFYNDGANYVSGMFQIASKVNITDARVIEEAVATVNNAMSTDLYTWDDYYDKGYFDTNESIDIEEVAVAYQLRSGRRVYRRYTIPRDDARKLYATYADLPEYKQVANILNDEKMLNAFFDENYKLSAEYTPCVIDANVKRTRDSEMVLRLYQAMRQDFDARTYKTVSTEVPVANISISANGDEDVYDMALYYNATLPVYADDKNTVAILEELGWLIMPTFSEENILWVEVSRSNGDMDENGNYYEDPSIMFNAGDEIYDKILGNIFMASALNNVYDESLLREDLYYVNLQGTEGYPDSAYFYRGRVPEGLDELLDDVPVNVMDENWEATKADLYMD